MPAGAGWWLHQNKAQHATFRLMGGSEGGMAVDALARRVAAYATNTPTPFREKPGSSAAAEAEAQAVLASLCCGHEMRRRRTEARARFCGDASAAAGAPQQALGRAILELASFGPGFFMYSKHLGGSAGTVADEAEDEGWGDDATARGGSLYDGASPRASQMQGLQGSPHGGATPPVADSPDGATALNRSGSPQQPPTARGSPGLPADHQPGPLSRHQPHRVAPGAAAGGGRARTREPAAAPELQLRRAFALRCGPPARRRSPRARAGRLERHEVRGRRHAYRQKQPRRPAYFPARIADNHRACCQGILCASQAECLLDDPRENPRLDWAGCLQLELSLPSEQSMAMRTACTHRHRTAAFSCASGIHRDLSELCDASALRIWRNGHVQEFC